MKLEIRPELLFELCKIYRKQSGRLPENDLEVCFVIWNLLDGKWKREEEK